MKRGIWSAVLAVLAVLALSSVALGHGGTATKTTLTASAKSAGFSGKVKSPKKSCRKHRQITGIYTALGGLPVHLGPVRSNGKGNWTISFTISGAYRSNFTVSATRKCKGATIGLYHH